MRRVVYRHVFPFRFQVLEGAPSPVAQQRMAEFCEQHDIPLLDVLEPFERLGSAAFVDYDHLSRKGSEVVAQQLIQSGMLRSPTNETD